VPYHSLPAPPMRVFFCFCTLLGVELGASTTWNTFPVFLLCIFFQIGLKVTLPGVVLTPRSSYLCPWVAGITELYHHGQSTSEILMSPDLTYSEIFYSPGGNYSSLTLGVQQ
jgi:hypothetical protein